MGVGLYSVSCGYGCGCGFGGFASLIAMVLALCARGAYAMRGYGDGISAGFSGIRESPPATLGNRHIFVLCAGAKMRFMPTGMREMHFRTIFGWTSAPLYGGCVISGDAKMQRYRQSRQCPTRRGRHQTAAPSTMGKQKHGRQSAVSPVQCGRILAPVQGFAL